ncbi:ORF MSV127 hypothetical protein [Melanoplus sanguinipes entomopoxvirus]|uniref:Uncharacterized protein n=1 Tax=Melanoplus sanguinipes entomopoxvirus TaxID=83191 RepID=Q9YVW5_MSEPV|nr:ORF MSV127 hypothetical protein [Melanoplus sanguinipes entomopoxvirus]AAC97796.1 ORF MSV127 hypothetical protein [Melanoplus sanguinipes entomopoxvirus 'O']
MYINGIYKTNNIEIVKLLGNYDIFYIDNKIIDPYYDTYELRDNISIYKTGKVLSITDKNVKELINIYINQTFISNIPNPNIVVSKVHQNDVYDYKFMYKTKIFKFYNYERLIKNYIHIYEKDNNSNFSFDFINSENIVITTPIFDSRQSSKYYAFKIYDEVTGILDACGIYR